MELLSVLIPCKYPDLYGLLPESFILTEKVSDCKTFTEQIFMVAASESCGICYCFPGDVIASVSRNVHYNRNYPKIITSVVYHVYICNNIIYIYILYYIYIIYMLYLLCTYEICIYYILYILDIIP